MTQKNKTRLRLVIDVNAAALPRKSGVGYYTLGLLEALARYHGEQLEIVGHYYNFLGRQSVAALPQHPAISYKVSRLIPIKLVNLLRRCWLELPYELLTKKRSGVHFFPNYLSLPSLFKTPCICTIHDLSFIDVPETLSQKNLNDLKRFVPKSLKRATAVATVSKFTAERITKVFAYNKPIIVTYTPPQAARIDKTQHGDVAKLGITKQYLLFVGNLEPRKNLENLITAYSLLTPQLQDTYQLVLAGGKGWNSEKVIKSIAAARQYGLDIVTSGYVTDEQRNTLYAHASVFVFPSYYEGQGIPPLEAMAAGVPVIVSDIPVLKEVCQQAAMYCKPDSPQDIADSMAALLGSSQKRSQLIEAGQQRVSNFSWEAAAKTMYEAIVKLATKKS